MLKYKYIAMLSKSRGAVKSRCYVQWLAAILANTTLLTYGLQSGWISPMSKVLQADTSPLDGPLSAGELSWIASTMCLSAVVGVPIYAYIADTYGRRVGIVAIAVPQALCWLIKLFTTSTAGLVIARICCGIPAGGCFNLIPMYVKEISQDNIRGALGSLMILMQNIGILAMYAMGSYLGYYTVLRIVLGIPIMTAFLMLKAPESPAFLIKVGKNEEAAKTVAFLRSLNTSDKLVQAEVYAMSSEDQYYKSLPKISFLTILKTEPWRRAFILSTAIISISSINGNFAILTHAASILASSGVTVSPELQALSFPAIMIVGSLASMCTVEKLGRKLILISTFVLTACALVCLASTQVESEADVTAEAVAGAVAGARAGADVLPVVAIVVSLWAYSAGVSPIPYIIMSEMFNFQIRAKALGFIVTYAWLMSFTQLFVFGVIPAPYVAFFVFAAVNVAGAAVAAALPETRGKTVEQIERELTQ